MTFPPLILIWLPKRTSSRDVMYLPNFGSTEATRVWLGPAGALELYASIKAKHRDEEPRIGSKQGHFSLQALFCSNTMVRPLIYGYYYEYVM